MAKALGKHAAETSAGTAWKRKSLLVRLGKQYQLLILSVPFMLVAILFSYVPLWGWIMAFQHYSIGKGVLGSPFAGLDNFRTLFQDTQFYLVLRNTIVMSLMSMIAGFACSIGLALLLNEVRRSAFKRLIQTLTYIPHFVSWVVIASIMGVFLSPDDGILNALLMKLGLIKESVYFMGHPQWFWWIHTMAGLWKEMGWNTIIYLAVLSGLNPEHYEAAEVDGATRFQKMRYISIPGLMPTAILLLTMSLGWIIQNGFESQFLLGNDVVRDYSEVLDLYALRYSTQLGDFSYGMAVSMFKTLVSVILVLLVTYIAKRNDQSRLF